MLAGATVPWSLMKHRSSQIRNASSASEENIYGSPGALASPGDWGCRSHAAQTSTISVHTILSSNST